MKIINDTLKKRDGTWDKQALTMFISFGMTLILGIINTFFSYYLGITENKMAMGIFDTFAILTGTLSGTNIGNKLVDMAKAKNQSTTTESSYSNTTYSPTQEYTPRPDRTDG